MSSDMSFTLRNWNEFIDHTAFKLPESADKAKDRLLINGRYYIANYAVVFGVCSVIGMLVHSGLVVPFGFFIAVFVVLNVLLKDTVIEIKGYTFTKANRALHIPGVIFAIALYWTESVTAFCWVLGLFSILMFVHALLRVRSLQAHASNAAHGGDLSGAARGLAAKVENAVKKSH
eukprot:TRINITY_DN1222_c0_g1_i1.p1 TRINITY_DN1222_c0_g1~~TRINITY_DN1222_c0_g1_i1.p1  ORF type:complete len:175 (-),score=63.91 TRINITY_DN1222_c0_g1_i1:285-809(-)